MSYSCVECVERRQVVRLAPLMKTAIITTLDHLDQLTTEYVTEREREEDERRESHSGDMLRRLYVSDFLAWAQRKYGEEKMDEG